jgi:hypothetical protein
MDWKNKLQAARDSGQNMINHQTDSLIEQHWPQVQLLFQEKVGPAALAAANDNSKMELTFKIVYSLLPAPVKLVVKEGTFIQFCFSHRDQLLPRVNPAANPARS